MNPILIARIHYYVIFAKGVSGGGTVYYSPGCFSVFPSYHLDNKNFMYGLIYLRFNNNNNNNNREPVRIYCRHSFNEINDVKKS